MLNYKKWGIFLLCLIIVNGICGCGEDGIEISKVIEADNAYGAVFDMSLDEFKKGYTEARNNSLDNQQLDENKSTFELLMPDMENLTYDGESEISESELYICSAYYEGQLYGGLSVCVDKETGKIQEIDYTSVIQNRSSAGISDVDLQVIASVASALKIQDDVTEFFADLKKGKQFAYKNGVAMIVRGVSDSENELIVFAAMDENVYKELYGDYE